MFKRKKKVDMSEYVTRREYEHLGDLYVETLKKLDLCDDEVERLKKYSQRLSDQLSKLMMTNCSLVDIINDKHLNFIKQKTKGKKNV